MTLKELIEGKKVRFKYYRDGALRYETGDAFEFPVPIADTWTGIFKAENGAIQYMRWIRKHLAELAEWDREREEQARNMAAGSTGYSGLQASFPETAGLSSVGHGPGICAKLNPCTSRR